MNILHVIPSANLEAGGPIEGIRQSIATREQFGLITTILTFDLPNSPFFADIPCTVIGIGPSYTAWGYCPALVPWLKKHAAEYQVIIINGIWMYHAYGTWVALHKTTTPFYVFTHGMLDPWFRKRYPLKHLKKWFFWPWAEYRVLRDAKAVLFTTEDEKILARQSFPSLYRCNEEVISYGTKAPTGNVTEQKELFLSSYPHLRDRRFFLFLSRIHPKKGCDLLIRAFAKVAERDPKLHLVMAGPDRVGLQAELEKLAQSLHIAEKITWTGMLKGDLKWGAYYAADVFALTSHQENFGIVVAEALACGLPVLITKQVNIWREVEEAKAGLVEVDNQEGADELLQKWVNTSAEEKIEISKNALTCFNVKFEIGHAVKSLLNVLEKK